MGLICLQGGNELTDACRDMDAYLLERAGGGPVVVLPYAATPGRDEATVVANATAYYRGLGATDISAGPDRLNDATLVVIPGGSPRRLQQTLRPLAARLSDAAADPTTVVTGSSAGAMLLCAVTVLPEPFATGEGIGLVDDFAVVPHWTGPRPDWEDALRNAAPGTDLLGIPECSGVLLEGESVTAVGQRPATLVTEDGYEELAL
ncbi:MAG TPA: Type 1 glutamine amidotransferase-like domain-containing protein [Mycobacteriales bacterium]|jgi:cyanophycinase